MLLVMAGGLLFVLFMALGHPEVWDQSQPARNFAVWFLYPWLVLVGYLLGRRRRQNRPAYYMAQCGHCGASELIPRTVPPEEREQWAVHWAKEHNAKAHPNEAE